MDYSQYERLRMDRRGRILTVTLNRPETRNAVDGRMHEELATIFYDVQLDEQADVIVLTGAGSAFSAGGDLNWLAALRQAGSLGHPAAVDAKKIVFGLLDLEKPIIARIPGPCLGLGTTIALLCDVIYAAESARIGDPHVRVGLVAGDGGAVIWPQLVGYARAKEYLLTGDLLSAQEAERIGLINHAVPDGELDRHVYELAERLAAGATKAIRWTKTAVNIGLKQLAHSVMDASMSYEMLTMATTDHGEAIAAFQEKRKPTFHGV
jgi:enoyl-CoA hydratase